MDGPTWAMRQDDRTLQTLCLHLRSFMEFVLRTSNPSTDGPIPGQFHCDSCRSDNRLHFWSQFGAPWQTGGQLPRVLGFSIKVLDNAKCVRLIGACSSHTPTCLLPVCSPEKISYISQTVRRRPRRSPRLTSDTMNYNVWRRLKPIQICYSGHLGK